MHICPACNREVEDPDRVLPPRANPLLGPMPWQETYEDGILVPMCPCGARLKNWLVGEFRELSPVLASLRGLAIGACVVILAGLADEARRKLGGQGFVVLPATIVGFAAVGFSAFWAGLVWSGREGPVRRLANRAYGVAAGFLVPPAAIAVALRAGWLADLSVLDPLLRLLPRSQ